ncbi:MAG: heme lyase CcmF/NrfE family subunit [Gammaproteobacteria bacterium]|nr:heme lyase CcmF/NrfE family subunit [Gammaproteobacteria bacterium]
MIPEYGHFALILALCLSLVLAVVPMLGATLGRPLWMASARPLAFGQLVLVAISFGCLAAAFLGDDFSVRYVAQNGNSLLPVYYKISAVWGAHEGSLLLWVLVLAGWTAAVAAFSRELPPELVARVLAVMGMIAVGFHLFLLLTSNPFERLLPMAPAEGRDLNPLLQDFGLIVHPPLLYMGYVGLSVPFAFAIAALLGGRMDVAWTRWTRPWTNIAWAFLTIGITLGSWWAYYELGWGGWWFWDPVENASFMPWLIATALVHSLAVTEKRGLFRGWTLLLAIFAFALSLLGTFMVRSGVLTSVHAFASDPTRGVFVLAFLGVVIGGSLLLYGLRAPALRVPASFGWRSREAFVLANNGLLAVITAVILLGTLYPLVADVMGWGKISVGPPYFNSFFVPLTLALALLMGIGALLQWKDSAPAPMARAAGLGALVAVPAAGLLPWLWGSWQWGAALALAATAWIAALTVRDLWRKSAFAPSRWQGLQRLRGGYWGMVCAHLGIAVAIAGAGVASSYSVQQDVRMEPGDTQVVAGYEFRFDGVTARDGPNYHAQIGAFDVRRDGHPVAHLEPEKRRYQGGQVMTEAGIDAGLGRDLYVVLGEPLDDTAWAVRLHVKPLVRWLWLGGALIAIGAVVAVGDRRYRRPVPVRAAVSANVVGP